jgi:hypothetical protein
MQWKGLVEQKVEFTMTTKPLEVSVKIIPRDLSLFALCFVCVITFHLEGNKKSYKGL